MQWLSTYRLFLFDFDGLLVDTEQLHYRAYINMCNKRGFHLSWSFEEYSKAAHFSATALRDNIYTQFPELKKQEGDWRVLYAEKSACYLDLLGENLVPLLPGVKELLLALQAQGIKRCVVTHSAKALVDKIRAHNPILDTIPNWITREDYTHPKPSSECYNLAIEKWAAPQDRIIGFEDSPRGLQALLGTRAKAVLICPSSTHYIEEVLAAHPEVSHFPSFSAIDPAKKFL